MSGRTRAAALGLLVAAIVSLLISPIRRLSESSDAARAAPYRDWKTWTSASGLPAETVWCVLPAPGGVWAGTTNGLAWFDGSTFRVYGTADGLAHRAVTSLALDPVDRSLWIGTMGGVSRFDGKRFTSYTQSSSGLVNDVVYTVAIQGDTVWMGTANGLSALDRRTGAFATYDDKNAPFHENWCYGAAVHDDKLYLGVWGGGLCVRDGRTGRWEAFTDPDGDNRIDLLPDDGIPSDVIVTASAGDDRVWVASYYGIGMYDGRRWKGFGVRSGLPTNFVNTVKASGRGCWAGTDSGLAHFDGDETWTIYRRGSKAGSGSAAVVRAGRTLGTYGLNGSPGSDFIWSVAEEPATGKLWVGTANGLSLAVRSKEDR